jgi:crotonobetainyl-CoA:carnitine CoA-transferase CaiB-like acyl-CoA transferase
MLDGYPLEGVKVLDFTQYVAGPYCSQVLADLGATVLKVERPGSGDVYRGQGPVFLAGESVSFLALNRGKRSIAMDLRDPEDQATLRALAGEADVLVENMTPGTLSRYGLGYEELSEIAPGLVYCSIAGFGQRGPLAAEGAYDLTIQALSGLMSMTGHPGRPPAKIPVAALDFGSALYAVIGIQAALWQRRSSGRGQWVQTSLLETSLAWLSMHIATRAAGGEEPQRLGTRSPFFAPYEAYATADGHIVVVGTGGGDGWERFCRAIDRTDLIEDERFADNSLRVANVEALRGEIEQRMASAPTAHWEQRLREERVPCAPVQTLDQVLVSEQVAALEAVRELDHPVAGAVTEVRLPITLSAARSTAERGAPALDEHAEVRFGEATGER